MKGRSSPRSGGMTTSSKGLVLNSSPSPWREQGFVLLMVLWIMALLSVLVSEFAYSMRTEVNITRNFKEDVQSYYLARAGFERALAELTTDFDYNYLDDYGKLLFAKVAPPVAEGKETSKKDQGEGTSPGEETAFGEGTYSFRIIDQEGKLNINTAVRDRFLLGELLLQAGVKDTFARDTIIDSLQDWVDRDDLHRLNGAEDSYYLGLSPPYRAKNDRFSTVEELLLVRGITEEIFYGASDADEKGGGYKGLINFITVTRSDRVNINTAPEEVLRALGYDDAHMEVLRSNTLRSAIPPPLSRFPRGMFKPTVKSSYFTIEGTGRAGGTAGKRVIQVDVLRRGMGAQSMVNILRWDDNYFAKY